MKEKVSPTNRDAPQFIVGWHGWGVILRSDRQSAAPTILGQRQRSGIQTA